MKDTKETLKCPACGKEMEKVFIEDKGFFLDICTNGCGGILFDNQEFKHFDEQHEDISVIEEKLKGKIFEKTEEHKERVCPVCNAKMVKNYASAQHKIQIDECYSCGAKFLDGGELSAIREQYKNDADRALDFNKLFMNKYSEDLAQAEAEAEKLSQKRSFTRRKFLDLYDKYHY